jgi:hypothetical protein
MSLTKDQKKELERLSHYFKKIEKLAIANNIDLDVFMSQYRNDGYDIYTTEKISLDEKAEKRRNVLEREGKEKIKAQKED